MGGILSNFWSLASERFRESLLNPPSENSRKNRKTKKNNGGMYEKYDFLSLLS